MKTYTLISNKIAQELKPADLLRYTALSFMPRIGNETDSTFQQIGDVTGEGYETIKKAITRLKKSTSIEVREVMRSEGRRNIYTIKEPIDNYKFINKCIFELPIEIGLKGFIIQLKSITINNTDKIDWSINNIAKHINCDRGTITRYIDGLIYLGYLIKTDKGYELTTNVFETTIQDEERD